MSPHTRFIPPASTTPPDQLAGIYDVAVIGGGPAGAIAAEDMARAGHRVLLLDRPGKIKPCGGAIPPRAMRDFAIPPGQIVARARSARMVSPTDRAIDMPINGGFVGMVDRETFDPWLRERAAAAGADLVHGTFDRYDENKDGTVSFSFMPSEPDGSNPRDAVALTVTTRFLIGADGARSKVARQAFGAAGEAPCVFAYHEIIDSPADSGHMMGAGGAFDPARCDVWYQGELSPDFYAWIFPHGEQTSVGVGSANKGFSLRGAVRRLREKTGLDACETVRTEGAPIPLKPLKKWDNGRNLVLAGDAAGVVAPASGEGIYYAMACGRQAAEGVIEALATGDARTALASVRKRYMKAHGKVFWVLGILQHFWYSTDKRRERFVTMCADPDVQTLTWQAYMNKELVRAKPAAHVRIFLKDMAHLLGIRAATQ
jgi:geranylgeranyl diphosphate/geranylgeranyl-bacteriochlorophyllide a reductase